MMEATRLRRQADYHSRFVPIAIARQLEERLASENDTEAERLDHLRQCLEQVNDSSRELIRQRYEENLSMKDIGLAVNRTAGAIRKQLCLIRRQLHECIERKMTLDGTSGQ